MNIRSAEVKQKNKRSQIIEAAIDLFVAKGFQDASMALLSKKSGIAIGTIYHYFKSKNDLIEGAYFYVTQQYGEAIQFTKSEAQLSLKERFELLWIKSYTFYIDQPSYYFLKDSLNYSPLISKELMDESRKYYQVVFDLIKEGIEANTFSDGHPVAMCMWLYNALLTPVQLKLGGEMEMSEEELLSFINMSWKGITSSQLT